MNLKLNKILSHPDRVFRAAGLLACAITGLNAIFTHIYGGNSSELSSLLDALRSNLVLSISPSSLMLVDVVGFTLFGWAFWRNMDGERIFNPERASIGLLGLQSFLGLLISPSLFFIVAAEACFILSVRAAFIWVLLQMAAGISLVMMLPDTALPGIAAGQPRSVALLIQSLMYPMVLFFSYCLGLLGATEWRQRRELAHVNAELKATQALQANNVRLAERLYISRELHDALGHHLVALSVNLQLASRLTTDEAATPLREAHLIARALLSDVREVVSTMRHESSLDLRRALETLAAGVKHPKIHVCIPDDLKDVDPLQAHTMFRCAQEIVTNAMRHAGARNLWLEVSRDDGGLSLRAHDDGRGAEQVMPGNGLRGMRERIEEYGGELQLESKTGNGFTAKVWLPLAAAGGTR